jgi:hypothetical protein
MFLATHPSPQVLFTITHHQLRLALPSGKPLLRLGESHVQSALAFQHHSILAL